MIAVNGLKLIFRRSPSCEIYIQLLRFQEIPPWRGPKMIFLTIESANKAEINILLHEIRQGRGLVGPSIMGNDAVVSGSIARDVHLGLRTNLTPFADAKFILVSNLFSLTVKPRRMGF